MISTTRPSVFVSTPYRADPEKYVLVARELARMVLVSGGFPLITQTTYHQMTLDDIPDLRDSVLAVGLHMVEQAEGLIVHPELEKSQGMQGELELASKLNKRVLFLPPNADLWLKAIGSFIRYLGALRDSTAGNHR